LLLLATLAFGGCLGQIRFSGNGYNNVIVSISPDLDEANANTILRGIEVIMNVFLGKLKKTILNIINII